MKVYEADWICPITAPPIRRGAIGVENGRITKVGTAEEIPGLDRVYYTGSAIIPGFINAHAHLELTILRGLLENLPFVDWIQSLVRAKYQLLTRDDLKVSAQLGALEMLRAGVTSVAEVMDLGTGWEAMREFGLQGIAYQEVFGPAESASGESMKVMADRVDSYRRDESETMRIGVSPHAPYTVSRPLYEAVRDYARRESLRMTAHIGESRAETMFVRDGAGPFATAHRKRDIQVMARHCMPIAYLQRIGLLGPDMLLIHGVEADDQDLEILRRSGTHIVHCPKSNAKLGNATARIKDMRDRAIHVSLGTDSVASNNVVDMFEEMRAAIFQQRTLTGQMDSLTASNAFRMATIEGAMAMGLENQIGSLDLGKRADFSVVDLSGPATQPVYDPIETMVYSSSRSSVRAVFLAGRETSFDETEILKQTSLIAEKLKGSIS